MFYLAMGLSISLTTLSAPFSCLSQIFWWRGANDIILTDTDHPEQVPKTVEEMAKLIEALKNPKVSE